MGWTIGWKQVSMVSASLLLSAALAAPAAAQSGGVASPGSAQIGPKSGGTGMATFLVTKGVVTAKGVGMRTVGSGTITISGIPAGAKIKKAYLYWAELGAGVGTGAVDGTPVTGTVIGTGPSPCFSNPTVGYRVDVKPLVKARPDPNGAYALTGFANSGSLNVAPETEGATLVIIWKELSVPKRVIVLNDGVLVTTTSGDLVTTTFSSAGGRGFEVKAPVAATLTMAGGDGQASPDITQFNGTPVGTSDNWNQSDGGWWDTDSYDVTSLIVEGATSATSSIGIPASGGDCISWTTSILAVTGKKTKPTN